MKMVVQVLREAAGVGGEPDRFRHLADQHRCGAAADAEVVDPEARRLSGERADLVAIGGQRV